MRAKTEDAYHHGNLRQVLLEAGERLLKEMGVAGLTLRGLARAAGVSHAAPYRHFGSKLDLLSALAAIGFIRLEREMAQSAAMFPDDPKRQLLESGERYVRLGLKHPAMFQLMFGGAIPKDEMSASLAEAGEGAFGALVGIISRGQEMGVFREEPALDLAMAAWSMAHGITELAIAGRLPVQGDGPDTFTPLTRRLCLLLVSGVAGP